MPAELEAPETEESFVEEVAEETQPQKPDVKEALGSAKPAEPEWQKPIRELAETVRSAVAPKPEPQRQPTKEEIEEYWAVWNPTKSKPDFYEKFFRLQPDMDPAEKQAQVAELQQYFGEMQTGLMRQAVTAARHLLAQEVAKLREEFAPIQETVATSRQDKLRQSFNSSYPALADPKYANVLKLASSELANQDFQNEGEYFKALAERAAKELSDLTGQPFDLGAAPTTKPTVTSPRLPRTSAGGTGGSGGSRATAPVKKSDDDSDTLDWMR